MASIAGQRHDNAPAAERIRLGGHQVPEQPVGRPGDVHLGHPLGPARCDAARVERHAQVPGVCLEEPPGEFPQARCLGLGRVQDHLAIHAGRLTLAAGIPAG